MGNLICIAGPRKSGKKEVDLNRQISPIPSLRHLKPKPAKQDTLQDICVGVVADNIWTLNAQILPPELIQRVVDVLCDSGKVNQSLLHSVCLPWLHQLQLADYPGCSDTWLAAAATCSSLLRLDLTNCNLVTDAGFSHVSKLPQLRVLLLVNCCQISDEGLQHISGLTRLRELSLEGCEGLTSEGLSSLRPLTQLKKLSLAQGSGLKSQALWHLTSLVDLEELSLAYCWHLGQSSSDFSAWVTDNAENPDAVVLLNPDGADTTAAAIHGHGAGAALRSSSSLPSSLAAVAAASGRGGSSSSSSGGCSSSGNGGGGGAGALGPVGHLRTQYSAPAAIVATAFAAATAQTTAAATATANGSPSSSAAAVTRSPPWGVLSPLVFLRRLSSLSLAGTRVTDEQLLAVAGWMPESLQRLDLSNSSITAGRGLQGLTAMAGSLTDLNLRCVKVGTGPGPLALASLTGLQRLDLSCSGLDDRGLQLLHPLTGLTSLNLDMCDGGDGGCQVLRHLSRLRHLDLSEVRLSDTGAGVLKGLRELEVLVLSNTNIGPGAIQHITGLSRLTQLHLDARNISDTALLLLRPLAPTLRELDLHGARVTPKGAAALKPFTALQKLDLCGAVLTDRSAGDLAQLSSLQHLSLAQSSRLGDQGVRLLAAALGGQLEALNLSYTGTSDAALPLLGGMKALRVVVLTGSKVTPGGATWLRKTSPGLLVKCNHG